jgi:hypothetical protein
MAGNSDFEWDKWFSPTGKFQRSNIPAFVGISASDRSEGVLVGLWRDYSLPSWRGKSARGHAAKSLILLLGIKILVSEEHAQMISNTVAVALALTLPRLWVFVKLLVPMITKQWKSAQAFFAKSSIRNRRTGQLNRIPSTQVESGQAPVVELENIGLPAEAHQARIGVGLGNTFIQASNFENAAGRLVQHHLAMPRVALADNTNPTRGFLGRALHLVQNFTDSPKTFTWISVLALLLFGSFIGQQILAISAASILSDSTAISTSPHCGAWSPDGRGIYSDNNSIFEPIQSHYKQRGVAAITYAETCYSPDAKIEQCRYVYQPRIEFHEFHNVSCPFLGDVCLLRNNSAFTLDTGYVDAEILGINEPERVQFRLTKVCAPVVVNETYIETRKDDAEGSLQITYRYESPSSSNLPTLREIYPKDWNDGGAGYDVQ